jgi:hypothetical protein
MNRPKPYDRNIITAAAKEYVKKLEHWNEDSNRLEQSLIGAFNADLDTFAIAKRLDYDGFDIDEQKYDDLGEAYHVVNKIAKLALKQWVIDEGIKLELPIGSKITAKDIESSECEIVQVYPETAEYGVWWEGYRVPKGQGHRIIKCEDVMNVLESNAL